MQGGDELRIEPADARAMIDAGTAIALDVVQPAAWSSLPAVVRGSVRIPPDEVPRRIGNLRGAPGVVAYCT